MAEPEELARQAIDLLLEKCGWQVQDKSAVNLHSQLGVAVRELSFKTGEPDYRVAELVYFRFVFRRVIPVQRRAESYRFAPDPFYFQYLGYGAGVPVLAPVPPRTPALESLLYERRVVPLVYHDEVAF